MQQEQEGSLFNYFRRQFSKIQPGLRAANACAFALLQLAPLTKYTFLIVLIMLAKHTICDVAAVAHSLFSTMDSGH